MSAKSNLLKTTTELLEASLEASLETSLETNLETSLEIKSFIHQQIIDFSPFITPATLIVVIARDPQGRDTDDEIESLSEIIPSQGSKHRIAIVLKEADSSIEAEARHDDIYEAIKIAKESLVSQLLEIRHEMESSQDRLVAIQNAKEKNTRH